MNNHQCWLLHPFSYNKKHKLEVAKKMEGLLNNNQCWNYYILLTAIGNNTLGVTKKNGRGDIISWSWSCWIPNFKDLLHNRNSNSMQQVQDIKVSKFTSWVSKTFDKLKFNNNSYRDSPQTWRINNPTSYTVSYKIWTSINSKYKKSPM